MQMARSSIAKNPTILSRRWDISASDHMLMVAAVLLFIDSAISKTVNVREEYPFEDFVDLYIQAWKHRLKGITTLPPEQRPEADPGSLSHRKSRPTISSPKMTPTGASHYRTRKFLPEQPL